MDKPSAKSREWVVFRDESGRIAFNPKCNECSKECKQSFRATLVRCPIFQRKEIAMDTHRESNASFVFNKEQADQSD